jgi:hypothetical protein
MLSADYIVGLTDGEGCFYVNIRPPDKRFSRSKYSVATHFYLKMREDELDLLKKVKKFFGCGAIYYQKDKRRNHNSCYRYEINAQKDIHEVLIPFFDKHPLQSAKKKNYEIFREIAGLVRDKMHREEGGLRRIIWLKSQMNLGARPVREIRSPGSGRTPDAHPEMGRVGNEQ